MKKIILLLCIIFFSCKTKPITKEYLVGKKFGIPSFIMGSKYLSFIDNENINFIVHDKRSYGYDGTYTLENTEGKQFIRISNIKKFGHTFDVLQGSKKDYIMIEVKSPIELKVLYSGEMFKLQKKE